jgi:hypothetical protein
MRQSSRNRPREGMVPALFLCPLCKTHGNELLPILSNELPRRAPGTATSTEVWLMQLDGLHAYTARAHAAAARVTAAATAHATAAAMQTEPDVPRWHGASLGVTRPDPEPMAVMSILSPTPAAATAAAAAPMSPSPSASGPPSPYSPPVRDASEERRELGAFSVAEGFRRLISPRLPALHSPAAGGSPARRPAMQRTSSRLGTTAAVAADVAADDVSAGATSSEPQEAWASAPSTMATDAPDVLDQARTGGEDEEEEVGDEGDSDDEDDDADETIGAAAAAGGVREASSVGLSRVRPSAASMLRADLTTLRDRIARARDLLPRAWKLVQAAAAVTAASAGDGGGASSSGGGVRRPSPTEARAPLPRPLAAMLTQLDLRLRGAQQQVQQPSLWPAPPALQGSTPAAALHRALAAYLCTVEVMEASSRGRRKSTPIHGATDVARVRGSRAARSHVIGLMGRRALL